MSVMVARTWVVALAAAGVMAGCSDSGSDGGGQRPSYDDLTSEAEALGERAEDMYLTDPSDLPTSGSASYEGVIGFATLGDSGAPEDFAGELSLNVDFDDSELSGQASNFVTAGEEQLEGSLSITNGELDRDTDPEIEPTYTFDMNGTLSDASDDDFQVDAEGAGAFLGDSGEATFGVVAGGISSEDGTSYIEGVFLAD